MANISITAADVSPVQVYDDIPPLPIASGETIVKGNYARVDASSGKATGGNGTTAAELGYGGIVYSDDGANVVKITRDALLDVGEGLVALDFGTKIYVSDTDKTLANAADATVDLIVGYVVPGFGATTADKLLRVQVEVL